MKKVFLSLITIFMVLSLSVVLVKAEGETTVALEDGVQIRTDGNNGLRWQASVTNAAVGDEYGFLFAQGEYTVENFPKDTAIDSAETQVINELKDDDTFAVTMVNFPKSAAVQDITVLAYVKNGETVTYSTNVVVRNLSEVAVEAYEVKGLTEGFVKTVYDASETTFNLNGGKFVPEYLFNITKYNSGEWANEAMIVSSTSGFTTSSYDRIFVKYNEELGLYKVVGSNKSGSSVTIPEHDYKIQALGTPTNASELAAAEAIRTIIADENPTEYYLSFTAPTKNSCNVDVFASKNIELLKGNALHLGGGVNLPVAYKANYTFNGWFNDSELTGESVEQQGADRELHASFSPIQYSISYNLNEGAWVNDYSPINTYNVESDSITLPTAENIKIDGGTFVGWYNNEFGTGSPITSIEKGSYGNVILYAIWAMDSATEVVLNTGDVAAITQYNPTKFVNSLFTAGKFIINEVEYDVADGELYSNLNDAMAAAVNDDVIYLFGSETVYTFAPASTLTANVTLVGPNAGLASTATRYPEATINPTTKFYIYSSSFIADGVSFRKDSAEGQNDLGNLIYATGNSKSIVVKSSYIHDMNSFIRLESSYAKDVEVIVENCKIEKVGQFVVRAQYGLKSLNYVGNYLTTYGQIENSGAGTIRVEASCTGTPIVNIYNNYFNGNAQQSVNTLFRNNNGVMTIKYNTFNNVSQIMYASNSHDTIFNCNLYLDAEGQSLTAAPSAVVGTGVVADYNVATSEADRSARYAEFVAGTIPSYKINYELDGGEFISNPVTEFVKYEGLLELPEPMKDNHTFLGWTLEFESNEYVTSISASTNNDVTLYAQWKEGEAAPVVVELTEADLVALESLNATKVVNSTFTNGRYSLNETVYTYGKGAFSNIADALSNAEENDKIYLFAGNYSEVITLSVANITLYGPNYGIKGTETRNNEAALNGSTTISASDITLNGLKFATSCNVQLLANNTTITNIYSTSTTFVATGGENRKAILCVNAAISNFELSNSYFNIGSSIYLKGVFAASPVVTNATFENNYFTTNLSVSAVTGDHLNDGITIYNPAGKINIKNNEFAYSTYDYILFLGNYSNSCTEMNIIDNIFAGQVYNGTEVGTSGICVRNAPAGCIVNIIHNYFGTVSGTIISGRYSKTGSIYNIKYNIFDETAYRQDKYAAGNANLGAGTFNYEGNYYGKALPEGYIHATDYKSSTEYTKEMLEEAYAEYLATLE